ncbi:MAG: ABC transporter permease subunit [Rhodospirillales bacterium]|nr:MAG: ABC transporter permease subunit [Rhodospirillales bacterium]
MDAGHRRGGDVVNRATRSPAWRDCALAALVPYVPYLWLLLFFAAPFVLVAVISAGDAAPDATPPIAFTGSGGSYARLVGDPLYIAAYIGSLRIAALSTLLALLIGYPMAYAIARAPESWRAGLLAAVILPFWTPFLIRVYAWTGLLSENGLVNQLLRGTGVAENPGTILGTEWAVCLGIAYAYLPFMVLPLYATLVKLDGALLEAAADLGAPPWRAFLTVTLPLSLPGVAGGCLLVFIPAVGEVIVPDLLGGADTLMIGKVLWDEFFANGDWPAASAVAVAMLVMLVLPVMALQRARGRALERR